MEKIHKAENWFTEKTLENHQTSSQDCQEEK